MGLIQLLVLRPPQLYPKLAFSEVKWVHSFAAALCLGLYRPLEVAHALPKELIILHLDST